MASDLISRTALLKAMDERYKEIETEKQYPFASDEERGLTAGFCEVDELVNNQPTVDAVEVVRCKDCKYRNTEDCGMLYECMSCGGQWSWEYDNGYCSFGEKMDGGDK